MPFVPWLTVARAVPTALRIAVRPLAVVVSIADAISDFTAALKIKPRYAEAYNNRGIAHMRQGDHAGATEDFTAALKINPRYAKAYNNRGNVRRRLGKHLEAAEDLKKALDLDPEFAKALSFDVHAYIEKHLPAER